MKSNKWPKILPPLTPEQQVINNNFIKYWHEILANHSRYKMIENFNHTYVVKNASQNFLRTLEIGAGLGEHLKYEQLTELQKKNYIALELTESMCEKFKINHPEIQIHMGDCQENLPFPDNYFDRIIAIHVLEHLPNLPATVKEMHRLCDKNKGLFSIVIPCEGGLAYSLARELSAKRIFEQRYKQSYRWFIEREHINRPGEILTELKEYFQIHHRRFFPFILPSINFNLCIGLTFKPRI